MRFTIQQIESLFPFTPEKNIALFAPAVIEAISVLESKLQLYCLATIRSECEPFVPVEEAISHFNTLKTPFDKYDYRKVLGNNGPPDGERFRGRGYLQITGQWNYKHYGRLVGEDLLTHPERACDPSIAAKLLVAFIESRQAVIQGAIQAGNIPAMRSAVNGGVYGLERFTDTWERGLGLLC